MCALVQTVAIFYTRACLVARHQLEACYYFIKRSILFLCNSFLKNLVGKDITRISMPVHFNEPLSFTQVCLSVCVHCDYNNFITLEIV